MHTRKPTTIDEKKTLGYVSRHPATEWPAILKSYKYRINILRKQRDSIFQTCKPLLYFFTLLPSDPFCVWGLDVNVFLNNLECVNSILMAVKRANVDVTPKKKRICITNQSPLYTRLEFLNLVSLGDDVVNLVDLWLESPNGGVDLHYNDEEALKQSIRSGHLNMAELLVNKGANIHIRSNRPLIIAIHNENVQMMKILLGSTEGKVNYSQQELHDAYDYARGISSKNAANFLKNYIDPRHGQKKCIRHPFKNSSC